MYGTASPDKHAILAGLGAIPIDYHKQDFVEVLRKAEPDGLDFVFDGMGGAESQRGLAVLRNGGKLVTYAPPTGPGMLLRGVLKMIFTNLRPGGPKVESYGISALYMRDKKPFMEDLALLFKLLEEGKIKPIIHARFPILEAAKANALLESGTVAGNIVLLASELL
jgi:NADPH:quinone reductase-like Zn-dependent oxidoreductase